MDSTIKCFYTEQITLGVCEQMTCQLFYRHRLMKATLRASNVKGAVSAHGIAFN